MQSNISAGINQAYLERIDLLVVALTGRTGSGCSTTAGIFSKPFADISITPSDFPELEQRKLTIANRFCSKQWVPFKSISVSTMILGLLLEEEIGSIRTFFETRGAKNIGPIVSEIEALLSEPSHAHFRNCVVLGDRDKSAGAWIFYREHLSVRAANIRNMLENTYAPVFQSLGDNIRFSGHALSDNIDHAQLFTLIRAVKRLTKASFRHDQESGLTESTRIVIDAVRNPLELVYLRDQFSAFYAIAITANDTDRKQRLEERAGLSRKEISALDDKEYPETKKHLDSYENFVSQNIQDCIQKSDLFFANPGKPAEYNQNIRFLNAQVLRYTALMLRPGLITPTRDERCMQLAFVAKINSGCISRQVGAAVADANYSIKAVGWNDVPKGQVSCLLRDVDELVTGGDKVAFRELAPLV